MCIYHISFIHSSVNGHLHFHLLAAANNTAINTGVQITVKESLLSVLWGINLEVELLDHRVILYLTF